MITIIPSTTIESNSRVPQIRSDTTMKDTQSPKLYLVFFYYIWKRWNILEYFDTPMPLQVIYSHVMLAVIVLYESMHFFK